MKNAWRRALATCLIAALPVLASVEPAPERSDRGSSRIPPDVHGRRNKTRCGDLPVLDVLARPKTSTLLERRDRES